MPDFGRQGFSTTYFAKQRFRSRNSISSLYRNSLPTLFMITCVCACVCAPQNWTNIPMLWRTVGQHNASKFRGRFCQFGGVSSSVEHSRAFRGPRRYCYLCLIKIFHRNNAAALGQNIEPDSASTTHTHAHPHTAPHVVVYI